MEAVDYTAWRFWWEVLITVANFGIWIFVWLDRRRRARSEEVADLRDRVSDLEKDMQHAPSHADIQQVTSELSRTNASLQQLIGSFNGVQRAVDLINRHLISQSREGGR